MGQTNKRNNVKREMICKVVPILYVFFTFIGGYKFAKIVSTSIINFRKSQKIKNIYGVGKYIRGELT